MTKIAWMVAVVVACHPHADRAPQPPGDPQQVAEQSDVSVDEAQLSTQVAFVTLLKQKVAQAWVPLWRRIDPTGALYGTETRRTEVQVSLRADGELADIVVTMSSGIKELDDEGVRAFRAAAPFGVVPERLVHKDGQLTLRFSFFFDIAGKRGQVAGPGPAAHDAGGPAPAPR
jgi:TonB family protein